MYNRPHAPPCHRLGPLQGRGDAGQQRPVPVVLQNPPTTLDAIVLAVIRRIVRQLQGQSMAIRKRDQSVHELGPRTAYLRTVIQVEEQSLNVRRSEERRVGKEG